MNKIKKRLNGVYVELKLNLYLLKLLYLSNRKEFIITVSINIYQTITYTFQSYILMYVVLNIMVQIFSSHETVSSSHLFVWLTIYAIISFLGTFFSNFKYVSYRILVMDFEKYINNIFYNKMASIDLSFWETPDEMTKMQKIKEVAEYKVYQNSYNLLEIIYMFIGMFFNIYLLFTISPFFILLIILPSILNYLNLRKYGKAIWSIWNTNGDDRKNAEQVNKIFSKTDTKVEMKVNNTSGYFVNVYNRSIGNFMDEQIKAIIKKLWTDVVIGAFNNIITLSIYFYILYMVLFKRSLQLGSFTYLISNIGTIQGDFTGLMNTYGFISSDLPFIKDFYDFMNSENVIKSKEGSTLVERTNEGISIEFQNVWFKYPSVKGTKNGKYVLKGVSFKIESGKSVSIVGVNGAGKTTIVRLLLRIFDPDKGKILVNGVDIKDINLESYYNSVGILMQEFGKYWLNIKENIKLGDIENVNNDLERQEETIKYILDNTGLTNIVKDKLQNGVETMLSSQFSGGVDLSGGEWQKVAIGRVMYKKPKLLVLDEPTSAIDALNEELLFRKIEEEFKGKSSVLIISHRFSTVRTANKIIVIDNGRVKEEGTHEELMNIDDGMYKRMFETQAKGYM